MPTREPTSSLPPPRDGRADGWAAQRRSQPNNELLRFTVRWYTRLPAELRPFELGRMFARIANVLAANWSEPDATHAYLDDLLTDRRGGRRGFPQGVHTELVGLRTFYESLYPRPAPAG